MMDITERNGEIDPGKFLFFASYTGLVLAISPLVAAKLVNPEMKMIEPIRNDPSYFTSHLFGLFMAGFVGSSMFMLGMNLLNKR